MMQVSQWGNSLAIRLPAAVVEIMGLKVGDNIEVQVDGARVLTLRSSRQRDAAMLARLRKFRGSLPVDFKFSREEANSRGN
jgi:antitoxin MazE